MSTILCCPKVFHFRLVDDFVFEEKLHTLVVHFAFFHWNLTEEYKHANKFRNREKTKLFPLRYVPFEFLLVLKHLTPERCLDEIASCVLFFAVLSISVK